MAAQNYHPKRNQICAFCKRWNGDANLIFKHPHGFQVTTGVVGKCMVTNNNRQSTHGVGCRDYEPSADASKLL